MVFRSLHRLAPQYTCNIFTIISQLTSKDVRNSSTDIRIPRKTLKMDRNVFLLEM